MQPTEHTDPVARPEVKIGEHFYPLKYRHKDAVALKHAGIDIGQKLSGSDLIEHMPKILNAGLIHLGANAPKPSEVEEFISNLDFGELSPYVLAYIEAQKKVSPEAQAANDKLLAMNAEAKAKNPELFQ